MQLGPAEIVSPVRARLNAAACLLLASGVPAAAHAESASVNHLDVSGLFYMEQKRVLVGEPIGRLTHLFKDGSTLSAQLALDVITGSSPSGALPSSQAQAQTTTTPSGNVVTSRTVGQIPVSKFSDKRGALDLDWSKPVLGGLSAALGGHYSREKDYQSMGLNGRFTLETMQKLTTLTLGGGINHDGIMTVGGTPAGMADATNGVQIASHDTQPKQVTDAVAGVSRILTRRWMVGANYSTTYERGYLSEPYKVISVMDATTGDPIAQLSERRPATRNRQSVLSNSVYHLDTDVLYLSHRYYWDDWGVKSNTFDLRYRNELGSDVFFEPHVRLYSQTAASFYTFGLRQGEPIPVYGTSDYRLGALRSMTLGGTFGFRISDYPGEFTVRAEYIRQYGNGSPPGVLGVQQNFDLFPTVNIGSVAVGYSVDL